MLRIGVPNPADCARRGGARGRNAARIGRPDHKHNRRSHRDDWIAAELRGRRGQTREGSPFILSVLHHTSLAQRSMARVAAGTSSYRLWIYTSAQDTGGAKGHLTLKLTGTLGEVTFAHLEQSPARQGMLFAPGHCCEIFQQDDDVGSMLKLTVQYVSEAAVGGSHVHRSPWNLVQIIVRESATGSVRVFPASRTLTGHEQLLLTPRLTWFGTRPPRI